MSGEEEFTTYISQKTKKRLLSAMAEGRRERFLAFEPHGLVSETILVSPGAEHYSQRTLPPDVENVIASLFKNKVKLTVLSDVLGAFVRRIEEISENSALTFAPETINITERGVDFQYEQYIWRATVRHRLNTPIDRTVAQHVIKIQLPNDSYIFRQAHKHDKNQTLNLANPEDDELVDPSLFLGHISTYVARLFHIPHDEAAQISPGIIYDVAQQRVEIAIQLSNNRVVELSWEYGYHVGVTREAGVEFEVQQERATKLLAIWKQHNFGHTIETGAPQQQQQQSAESTTTLQPE